MPRPLVLGAALAFASSAPLPARSAPGATLLIVSKQDHVLEVRDAQTFVLRSTVPIGPDPHEIVLSSDDSTAYVSNPGYEALHRIDVIDLLQARSLPAFDTSPLLGPHGLEYAQNRLWFTAQGSKSIARLDPADGRIEWTMGTGQDVTHLIHVTPDGRHVYASNSGSGTLSLFEQKLVPPLLPPTGVLPAGAIPRLDWVQQVVAVGAGAEGFDVSPDGSELWTVTPKGMISIVATASGTVSATLPTDLAGAHRVAFTPDGDKVMIVSVKTGQVRFFDARRRTLLKATQTGRAAGIYMDLAGNRAFVSCTPDNVVAVFDLTTLQEVARIVVARPDGIAIASASTQVPDEKN